MSIGVYSAGIAKPFGYIVNRKGTQLNNISNKLDISIQPTAVKYKDITPRLVSVISQKGEVIYLSMVTSAYSGMGKIYNINIPKIDERLSEKMSPWKRIWVIFSTTTTIEFSVAKIALAENGKAKINVGFLVLLANVFLKQNYLPLISVVIILAILEYFLDLVSAFQFKKDTNTLTISSAINLFKIMIIIVGTTCVDYGFLLNPKLAIIFDCTGKFPILNYLNFHNAAISYFLANYGLGFLKSGYSLCTHLPHKSIKALPENNKSNLY